jgi:glycosyltransferase involved in cell wall biosynthesis
MAGLRRVGLDALPLQVRSGGVATYTRALVHALAEVRPPLEMVLFGLPRPLPAGDGDSAWPATVHQRRSPRYPLVLGQPGGCIPRLLRLEQVLPDLDCFHATAYAVPRTRRTPVVLTVHDLTLLRAPELGTAALRRTVRGVAAAARSARRVIADSETTRHDLVVRCGVAAARIRVVPLGVGQAFRPQPIAAAQAQVATRLGIDRPYLLHVGTLEPRKNLPALVRAWSALRAARADAPLLVLAGTPGWGAAAVAQAVAASAAPGDVRLLGRVGDADLPALYAAAEALVFPSLYEGFGLPLLEAMACGTPVIASRGGALPEVAGDAALLVDATDAGALAAAIARVVDDGALRAHLRASGLERARAFTWTACAAATLAVYEEAVACGG